MPLPFYENPLKRKVLKDDLLPKESFGAFSIIAIASGKGGVGKSTVTTQLAFALKEEGFKVGVLDADIYGPSLCQMIKEEVSPCQKGDRIIPAKREGVSFFSIAFLLEEGKGSLVRGPIANKMITELIEDIHFGPLDFLLVDFPPGTGDIPLTLVKKIPFDGALLITTPQRVSEIDVKKGAELFSAGGISLFGIIENMSVYFTERGEIYPFGKGAGKRLAEELRIELLSQIPLDPSITFLQEKGENLFSHPENYPSKDAFRNLAIKVIERNGVKKIKEGN